MTGSLHAFAVRFCPQPKLSELRLHATPPAPAPIPIFPAPPLPAFPQGVGWAGSCTFNTPGEYTFFCDAHRDFMKGTIRVEGTAPTPTPSPTVSPSPSPTASPSPSPS